MNLKVSQPLDLQYLPPTSPTCVRKVLSQHFPHIIKSFKLDFAKSNFSMCQKSFFTIFSPIFCAKGCSCLCNLVTGLELAKDIFENQCAASASAYFAQTSKVSGLFFLSIHSVQDKIHSFCARQNPFILCKTKSLHSVQDKIHSFCARQNPFILCKTKSIHSVQDKSIHSV